MNKYITLAEENRQLRNIKLQNIGYTLLTIYVIAMMLFVFITYTKIERIIL